MTTVTRRPAVRSSLAQHITAVEFALRLIGITILALAVGAWDWRAGLALAGVALILVTIELPRRSP